MTRQTVIAYWLIPSEPARSFFQKIIDDLARRYNAPVFQPHVTIHVGADRANAAEAITEAARKCKIIRLAPIGIDQSDEFTKTLFVQFTTTTELRQINEVVREAANDSSRYELKPHLSLLYKDLAHARRSELATSITVPFSEISFASLQAIRCVSPTQTSADVKAWELIATATFP